MSANPAVRLILQPLRKCIDAADYVDAWREKNKSKIAEAMSDPKKHRKSVTTKEICVDGSFSIQDRFGLTNEIETVAANLGKAGFPEIGDQFKALIDGVDETGGDDQIPIDAFRRLLDIHCPGPPTNDEAIYLGHGRINVGDTLVNLTNEHEVNALEHLVEYRFADTHELKRDAGISNPSETIRRMRKRDKGLLAKFIVRPGQKGKGGYSTTIIDHRKKK